jgi:hypothetical protein
MEDELALSPEVEEEAAKIRQGWSPARLASRTMRDTPVQRKQPVSLGRIDQFMCDGAPLADNEYWQHQISTEDP